MDNFLTRLSILEEDPSEYLIEDLFDFFHEIAKMDAESVIAAYQALDLVTVLLDPKVRESHKEVISRFEKALFVRMTSIAYKRNCVASAEEEVDRTSFESVTNGKFSAHHKRPF